MPHRVFTRATGAVDAATWQSRLDALRSFLRGLGLVERRTGESYQYDYLRCAGARQLVSLSCRGRHVTLYLFPDALDRAPGHASALYQMLDRAGFDLGSKAGPSIGLDLAVDDHVAMLCDGLRGLFG